MGFAHLHFSWPNMAEKCRERMFQAVCDVLVEEGQVQVSWGRMNIHLRFESGWGFLATRVWFLEWEIACLCIYIYYHLEPESLACCSKSLLVFSEMSIFYLLQDDYRRWVYPPVNQWSTWIPSNIKHLHCMVTNMWLVGGWALPGSIPTPLKNMS